LFSFLLKSLIPQRFPVKKTFVFIEKRYKITESCSIFLSFMIVLDDWIQS
jgi:hypothetical protein